MVGKEAFLKWEERGREDLEGRAIALMSARGFMKWLKSTDSDDSSGGVCAHLHIKQNGSC